MDIAFALLAACAISTGATSKAGGQATGKKGTKE